MIIIIIFILEIENWDQSDYVICPRLQANKQWSQYSKPGLADSL